MAEGHSPMEQFSIHRWGGEIEIAGVDVSFNNSAFWMVIVVVAITLFMVLGMRSRAIVPGRWQAFCELLHDFIATLVTDNVGQEGRRYFPFVFTVFMFVLFSNLFGLLPGAFTVTSHIIVTFALAISVFLLVTILGLARHGLHFFSLFAPKGVPGWMMPVMIPIEIISYLIRPITMSIRLFANMTGGHVLLAVIGSFVVALSVPLGIIPLTAIPAIMLLECLIAFLQAYVFSVLTCIYLHDAIHLH